MDNAGGAMSIKCENKEPQIEEFECVFCGGKGRDGDDPCTECNGTGVYEDWCCREHALEIAEDTDEV
jgi:DnaJ-class molecular chaperone